MGKRNDYPAVLLGTVATFHMGQAPHSSTYNDEGIGTPLIKAGDWGTLYPTPVTYTTNPISFATENDIIICVVGATAGKVNLGINASITRSVAAIRPNKEFLDQKFLFYHRFFEYKNLNSQATGSAQGIINKQQLYDSLIPLPPLPEQQRIVAKLDSFFAHLEQVKQRMEQIPVLLKQFRQAVLTQAVTGKLTEEWRVGKELDTKIHFQKIIKNRSEEYKKAIDSAKLKGDRKPSKTFLHELPVIEEIKINTPDSWSQTNIDFLAFVTKLAGFEYTNHFDITEDGEIPVVRAQNVQMGRFEDKNRMYISKKTSDYLVRSQLHGRELLMVFIGAGTGNVCLAPSSERWHLAPNVAKIDVDAINRQYLFYYLQSNLGIENVLSRVKATAQPSLSMETIREIVVLVPSLQEQTEIIRRVEGLFSKADAIEAQYKKLKEQIDQLPQAILAKAFRGDV